MFIFVILEIVCFLKREFTIHMLFLFPISTLVTRGTKNLTFMTFSGVLLSCLLSACFYLFSFMSSDDLLPFHLSIIVQEIELVQMAFCYSFVL